MRILLQLFFRLDSADMYGQISRLLICNFVIIAHFYIMRNLLAARIFNRVHSGDHFSETVIIIPEHLPRKNALSKKFQMSDESGVMKAFFLQFNIQIFTDDIDHVANETGVFIVLRTPVSYSAFTI